MYHVVGCSNAKQGKNNGVVRLSMTVQFSEGLADRPWFAMSPDSRFLRLVLTMLTLSL